MNTNTTIDLTAADAISALAAATAAPSEAIATYTDAQQCALVATASEKTIVQHWRNPSRTVAVNIPNAPFTTATAEVPPTYLPIITAVLEASAKRILKRTIENNTISPAP